MLQKSFFWKIKSTVSTLMKSWTNNDAPVNCGSLRPVGIRKIVFAKKAARYYGLICWRNQFGRISVVHLVVCSIYYYFILGVWPNCHFQKLRKFRKLRRTLLSSFTGEKRLSGKNINNFLGEILIRNYKTLLRIFQSFWKVPKSNFILFFSKICTRFRKSAKKFRKFAKSFANLQKVPQMCKKFSQICKKVPQVGKKFRKFAKSSANLQKVPKNYKKSKSSKKNNNFENFQTLFPDMAFFNTTESWII